MPYRDAVNSAELAIVAAFGAAILTGLASLGVVWFQEWKRGRAADRDTLAKAVLDMLSRSMAVASRAQAVAEMVPLRSGLGEGVDIATRVRKPLDMFEFHDWLAQDLAPLSAAWSVIWTQGDQEMVRLANALLAACSDLIGASTDTGQAGSYLERVRRVIVGERWTDEQRSEAQDALKKVAAARKALAEHARRTFGRQHVELFGHGETDDGE